MAVAMALAILGLFLLPTLAEAYRARVVAANPVVPKGCANSCNDGPFPDCLIHASLASPIERASKDSVDILVFPEVYGVEDIMLCPPKEDDLLPKDGTLLCPDSDAVSTASPPWWVKVACLAKKWHVLVVVGVYDWGPCVPGPDPFIHRPFPCVGNLTVFNKAVVFGVDGTLLAVHHKHHMAHTLTPTENISVRRSNGIIYNPSPRGVYNDDVAGAWPVPDVTVFTSHFGVKFGLIICHEINFASPLRSMISAGVRDVIFPTQWGGSYGGNFAATQSGFAIAHHVNLLSANGMSGGSGIWPADFSKFPVQFLAEATMVESPTPQWFGTLDLESPAEAILPPLMAPAPVYPIISKTQMLDASSSGIIDLNLQGVLCRLDLQHAKIKGGRFLFGASVGINIIGMFEASCWIFSCDMLHQPSHLTPDFARIAAWPLTKEDYDQCKESTSATAITFSGTPTVEIDSPYSNFFIPLGQCQDTSIPMPRPHGIELSSSSQRLVLPTECPMSYGGLRSFAQSDFEEPLCPNGFCPSPSPCNDTSWELTFDAWCLLIPEIPHEREDLQQSVLVV